MMTLKRSLVFSLGLLFLAVNAFGDVCTVRILTTSKMVTSLGKMIGKRQ